MTATKTTIQTFQGMDASVQTRNTARALNGVKQGIKKFKMNFELFSKTSQESFHLIKNLKNFLAYNFEIFHLYKLNLLILIELHTYQIHYVMIYRTVALFRVIFL